LLNMGPDALYRAGRAFQTLRGWKFPFSGKTPDQSRAVARFLRGVAEKGAKRFTMQWAMVNGDVGVVLMDRDRPATVVSLTIEEDGRISGVFLVNDPDKLPICQPV
jgi:hypothetical protein